ncbi:MAG TPA: MFS transporter [Streptosporangiaceae bacterium]|nr:MFS transporter [Streptosporangiaceae bacterium]
MGTRLVWPRTAGRAGRSGWRRQLSEGLRLVIHDRAVRLVIAVSAAVTFTSASFLVVEPLYARHVLHRPPSQFALFEAAAGTGAILAGLVISRIRSPLTGGATLMAAALPGTAWPHACSPIPPGCQPPIPAPSCGCGRIGVRRGCGHYTPAGRLRARARRVMSIGATLQSGTETVGLLFGGVTLAAPDALVLAGVALTAGLTGMTIVTPRPGGDVSRVT